MIETILSAGLGISVGLTLFVLIGLRRSQKLWIAHVRAENLRRLRVATDEFGDEYADVTLDSEGVIRSVSTISGQMLFPPFGVNRKPIVNRTEIGDDRVRA